MARALLGSTAAQYGGFADVDVLGWSFASASATTPPEAATLALVGAGLARLAGLARRRAASRC